MTQVQYWVIYDVFNDKTIGTWDSYEYAEQFLLDNADDFDCWSVMPADELITIEA